MIDRYHENVREYFPNHLHPALGVEVSNSQLDPNGTHPVIESFEEHVRQIMGGVVNLDDRVELHAYDIDSARRQYIEDTEVSGGLSVLEPTGNNTLFVERTYRHVDIQQEIIRSSRFLQHRQDVRRNSELVSLENQLSYTAQEQLDPLDHTPCYRPEHVAFANSYVSCYPELSVLSLDVGEEIIAEAAASEPSFASWLRYEVPFFGNNVDEHWSDFIQRDGECSFLVGGETTPFLEYSGLQYYLTAESNLINSTHTATLDLRDVYPDVVNCYTEDGGGGVRLQFLRFYELVAYLTWFHVQSVELTSIGSQRGWVLDAGQCLGRDETPLWKEYRSLSTCEEPLCPQPYAGNVDWASLDVSGGTSGAIYPDIEDESTIPKQHFPCGADHGYCSLDTRLGNTIRRCSCESNFDVVPDYFKDGLREEDIFGNLRIPLVMQLNACDLDKRAGCNNPSIGVEAVCGGHGQCVGAWSGQQPFSQCRCGVFEVAPNGGLGTCEDDFREGQVSECLLHPELEFLDNLYDTSVTGFPESCDIPPAGCRDSSSAVTYTRDRTDLYVRGESYSCEIVRGAVTNTIRHGACQVGQDEDAASCNCDRGRFGRVCERVTIGVGQVGSAGCFDPSKTRSQTYIFNPYLMGVELLPEGQTTTEPTYLGGGEACSGHGVCVDMGGDDPWQELHETLPPITNFQESDTYTSPEIWVYPGYNNQNYLAEKAFRETLFNRLVLNQRCLCDVGWGGGDNGAELCEKQFCENPACDLSKGETCQPTSDLKPIYECFCHVTFDGKCLADKSVGETGIDKQGCLCDHKFVISCENGIECLPGEDFCNCICDPGFVNSLNGTCLLIENPDSNIVCDASGDKGFFRQPLLLNPQTRQYSCKQNLCTDPPPIFDTTQAQDRFCDCNPGSCDCLPTTTLSASNLLDPLLNIAKVQSIAVNTTYVLGGVLELQNTTEQQQSNQGLTVDSISFSIDPTYTPGYVNFQLSINGTVAIPLLFIVNPDC